MSPQETPPAGASPSTATSSTRRRLLRGGLAAGPVVMTVASRPVLGQVACVSASAMGSAVMSGQVRPISMCSGLTPEQWAAMATQWPSPYVGQGATINVPAPTPTSSAPPPAVTTTTATTYVPRSGHGITIGSRSVPNYTITTTVQSPAQSTTAPISAAAAPASTTSSASTTCSNTAASATITSSYTPFANHGTTIGSRRIPTYTTTVDAPPPAPCEPAPTTIAQTQATTAPGTPFHCPTTGFAGSTYGTESMLDVIGSDRNPAGLGRYVVAALLNARAGRTPVLDESGVRKMWNDVVNRGYYEPATGVQWGPSQIVAYLRTTIG